MQQQNTLQHGHVGPHVVRIIALLVALAGLAVGDIPTTPNPIFQASDLMVQVNATTNGKLFKVDSDGVSLKVIHVAGDAKTMGYATGLLLAEESHIFLTEAIPQFIESQIAQINITKLPEWLQKAITGKVGLDLVDALLEAVWLAESKYISASQFDPVAEIEGLAQGMCDSGKIPNCNPTTLVNQINYVNMIPEIMKMTCSMFGAYGSATSTGKLIQLRSLDFGDGPFANYTIITVRHPERGNTHVSVSFPGMVGSITGFSTKVGISEKVWETYDNPDVQPGAFDGEPDAFVLRDIMQFSNNRQDAIAFTRSISRTWAIFIGVGDFESQVFNAIGYRKKDLQVFDDKNITSVTHEDVIEDVVYIDKHPQPSHDNTTMPGLMKKYHGSLTGTITAQYIPRMMQSGDLHIGIYDFGDRKAWFATGKVNSEGKYGDDDVSGKACNQPYLEFNMDDLFNEKV